MADLKGAFTSFDGKTDQETGTAFSPFTGETDQDKAERAKRPGLIREVGSQIGDALLYHLPAGIASTIEGTKPFESNNLLDTIVERGRKRSREVAEQPGGADPLAFGAFSRDDVRSLGPSLGFSGVGMAAGIGAGLPAAAVNPALGFAAGGAASGGAAYRMQYNSFMRDVREKLNADAIQARGTPVSDDEWAKVEPLYADHAHKTGLWEAVPEAIGNMAMAGILATPVKKMLPSAVARIANKNIVTRGATKLAMMQASELPTETVTEHGQHNERVRAGLTPGERERSFTSGDDWLTSFKEVAGPVLLQTAVMGGAGGAIHAGYKALRPDLPPVKSEHDAVLRDVAVRKDNLEQEQQAQAPAAGEKTTPAATETPAPAASPVVAYERELDALRLAKAKSADLTDEDREHVLTNGLAKQSATGELTLLPAGRRRLKALEAEVPIDDAAHQAAASPENERPEPSAAQTEAGNYKKGPVNVGGLDISIENPAGSTREDKANKPPAWTQAMSDHYGYVKGVPARAPDKEHVDTFIKPGTPAGFSGAVFVVDQNNKDGKFDEPKVMIGYESEAEARAAYARNYPADWKGLHQVTPMSMDEFKAKLQDKNAFMQAQPRGDQPLGLVPAGTTAPVAPTKHPNAVIRDVRDFDGQKLGDIIEPYDGTEAGAKAAAQRSGARLKDEFPTASNTQSRMGATDQDGNPKWAIAPNYKIAPVDSDEGQYSWGDLSKAPKKPALPEKRKELFVERDGKRFPVESLEDAAKKWQQFFIAAVREGGGGSGGSIGGAKIVDQDGKEVARISQNGRVWPPGESKPGTKPLVEAWGTVPQKETLTEVANDEPKPVSESAKTGTGKKPRKAQTKGAPQAAAGEGTQGRFPPIEDGRKPKFKVGDIVNVIEGEDGMEVRIAVAAEGKFAASLWDKDAEQSVSVTTGYTDYDAALVGARKMLGEKKPEPAKLTDEEQAKADLDAALGDLGDLLGKNGRLNITPEQEQKLLPVMTRLFDAAFRLGYIKFKAAARFVREKITDALGKEVADELTLEHYQGGYIAMSGRYKAKGAESAKEVAAVDNLDEEIELTVQPLRPGAPAETVKVPAEQPKKDVADTSYEDGERWWDRELTKEGRLDLASEFELGPTVAWRYMPASDRLKVLAIRGTDRDPVVREKTTPAPAASPSAEDLPAMIVHANRKNNTTGATIHVVTMKDRVERPVFDAMKARASRFGGRYSNYKGRGAIPGFVFTDEAKARAFAGEKPGAKVADAQQRLGDAPQQPANPLVAAADALIQAANAVKEAAAPKAENPVYTGNEAPNEPLPTDVSGPVDGTQPAKAGGVDSGQPARAGAQGSAADGGADGVGSDTGAGEGKPGRTPSDGGERDIPGERAGDVDGGDQRPGDSATAAGRDGRRGSALGVNYRITADDELGKGSWKVKARQNIDAIRALKRIVSEERKATPEEQAAMVKYVGWGATELANNIFEKYIHQPFGRSHYGYGKGYEQLGEELKALLTDEEYARAKESTQNAHYTSEPIIRAMWRAMQRFGFKGGRALEPGMGVGHFVGLMPEDLAGKVKYTGVELDPSTGNIAKHLYPQSDIRVQDFTKFVMPDNFYDVAIGNPPFADIVIKSDKAYKKFGLRLHDYFFAKAIDKVRPGGVLMFVTSKGTMDKKDASARKYIGERADLVGAIRLPQDSFKENAGTEVITDVLFFKKRAPGESAAGETWNDIVQIETKDGPTEVNEYFSRHPEMMLGEPRLSGSDLEGGGKVKGLYRGEGEFTLLSREGADIAKEFDNAVDRMPENVYEERASKSPEKVAPEIIDVSPDHIKEGAYYLKDGKVLQRRQGVGREADVSSIAEKVIRSFIPLRDTVKDVIRTQLESDDPKALKAAQAKMTKAYEAFVAKHGPINKEIHTKRTNKAGEDSVSVRTPNISAFSLDPEAYRVAAIESYSHDTGKATKRAIFTERVINPATEAETTSPADTLIWSLNEYGRLETKAMAERIGMDEDKLIEALGDAVYQDPATQQWVTDDEYLSGDVRARLRIAEESAKADRAYERNVEALKKVQPRDLKPSEIYVRLGAPWIDTAYIEEFARDALGVGRVQVTHVREGAMWGVAGGGTATVAATSTWGTERANAIDLLDNALNARTPRIYDIVGSGSDQKRVFNEVATQAAQQKQNEIQQRFSKWLWEDGERGAALAEIYNRDYNNIVPRVFDGKHMTLPGLSAAYKPYDHQRRVAWRIIQRGNTYMAHEVGAGKTIAASIAGIEMRRLGLIKKPAYVVPKHMLRQFATELLSLYPAAKVLVADEENFDVKARGTFMGRVQAENWDAVIFAHSSFGFVPISDEFAQGEIQEMVDLYEGMVADTPKTERVKRKQLERALKRFREKLEALTDQSGKDKGMTFEEAGIDFMFVDEAHYFRKLDFPTNQTNVKGITGEGSKRAMDLFFKTRYIDSLHKNRSLVLMSGTPITNTVGEMFTIQRFMHLDLLKERGIDSFDAWASMFGEQVTKLEPQADGSYKPITRFAKFVNMPELAQMWGDVGDVVRVDDMPYMKGKRPEIKGGKMQIVVGEQTEAQQNYKKELSRRIAAIEARKGPPKKGDDIILSVINDGRHAAMDQRFIGPSLPAAPESKLEKLIANTFEIWERTKDKRLTQMVFSDLGTPSIAEKRGFSAYLRIRDALVAKGVPAGEIAFIQDANTDDKKLRLFKQMNAGEKRVLIGGQGMQEGVNAQRLLYALHNLDAPFLPAAMEQRRGRALRQGNTNKVIELFGYVTKGSYDEQMFGILETKGRFIEQFLRGNPGVREMEDVDSEADAFAEAQALASDDPRIMRLAGLRTDLRLLEMAEEAHYRDQSNLKSAKAMAQRDIASTKTSIAVLEENAKRAVDTRAEKFAATIGDKAYTDREEAGKALVAALKAMQDKAAQLHAGLTTRKIGELGGFDVTASVDERATIFQDDEGKKTALRYVSWQLQGSGPMRFGFNHGYKMDEQSPMGAIRSLEGAVQGIPQSIEAEKANLKRYEQTAADADARIGGKFEKTAELADIRAKLADLEGEFNAEAKVKKDAAKAALEADQQSGGNDTAMRRGRSNTLTKDELEKAIGPLIAKWANPPKVRLLASMDEAPQAVRKVRDAQNEGGATGIPQAFIYRDTIYLVADGLGSAWAAQRALFHEALGHFGLRNSIPQLRPVLDDVWRAMPDQVLAKAREYGLDVKKEADRRAAAEEVLAELAETRPTANLVKRAIAQIRQWLRSLGLDLRLSENDIVNLFILPARRFVEQGQESAQGELSTAFNRQTPWYYSELSAKLEASPMKAAPAQGWKDYIKSLGTKGVKADEVEWSGINEWLTMQPGKVSKESVLDYLSENGVQVEETILGGTEATNEFDRLNVEMTAKGYTADFDNDGGITNLERRSDGHSFDAIDENGGIIFVGHYDVDEVLPDDVVALALRLDAASKEFASEQDGTDAAKFGMYVLPGAKPESYRELLLTLPIKVSEDEARKMATKPWEEMTDEAKETVRDIVRRNTAGFQSGHYDQKNILAHVRFNERTDVDGKRVLFLEELQSDWAQAGRRKGFSQAKAEFRTRMEQKYGEDWVPKLTAAEMDEYTAIRTGPKDGPSPAPFVTKTEAWTALTLRRMIRYAADNGFDRIAWTTGGQQAARYDLSKHLDAVRIVGPTENMAGFDIIGRKNNKTVLTKNNVPGAELDTYIGKELATKVISDFKGAQLGAIKSYTGLDLKVGGEGMRTYYDKIVPNVANDILKKLGGGRVSEVGIPPTGTPEKIDWTEVRESAKQYATGGLSSEEFRDDTGINATDLELEELRSYGADPYRRSEVISAFVKAMKAKTAPGKRMKQPGFDITPAMREKVLKGQPMFSRGEPAKSKAFKDWFGKSKVVDVDGEPLVVYHGTPSAKAIGKFRTPAYFTEEPSFADVFARERDGNKGAIYPVFLKIENPYRIDGAVQGRHFVWDAEDVERMKGDGHDGVIVKGGEDESDIYTVFDQSQIKSAIGNRGTFDGSNPNIAFSRTREAIAENVGNLFQSQRTFNRWWHKTVGTQFHKAQTDTDAAGRKRTLGTFGKVFDLGQDYLTDTSKYAMQAEAQAPNLLLRLEDAKDIFRRGISAVDREAIAKPIFEGTLDERSLTDDELRDEYKLNARQIELFHEFRNATDKSLDDLTKSVMAKMASGIGIDMAGIIRFRDRPLPEFHTELAGMIKLRAKALKEIAEGMSDGDKTKALALARAATAAGQNKAITELYNRVRKLKAKGYAPLTRFGEYTVYVTEQGTNSLEEPEQVFFGMYESQREANAAAKALAAEYPDATVTQGVLSQEAYRVFQGLSPDTLEVFAKAAGLDTEPLFQQYLKLAVNNRSALKRLIRRKGTPGFSTDVPRVLATFVTSNARSTSSNWHLGKMQDAVEAIPKEKGDVKDEAVKLWKYLTDPTEEAGALRGFLFFQYLGGSIASALVNTTQPLTMTAPYLAKYENPAAVAKDLARAAMEGARNAPANDVRAAYQRAMDDGILAPHEIYQLMAQARGTSMGTSGLGRLTKVWGALFSLAEAFNRRTTFIAAYRVGVRNGVTDAYEFAKNAVYDTQGLYNKGNRPNWARGATGATLFTFKQFSVSYVEFLKRLHDTNKPAFYMALAVLWLAAGLEGLPFAEDIEDLLDTIGQWLGHGTNTKKWLRENATNMLGKDAGQFVLHGVSAIPGVPLDVAGRMGMHNLIPGSAVLKTSEVDKTRDIAEFAGPFGGLVASVGKSLDAAARGDLGKAVKTVLPVAVQNLFKGAEMWEKGYYTDQRGRRVLDTTGGEAILKAAGFQPASVAKESRTINQVQQDISLVKVTEAGIAEKWARGVVDGKPELVAEARADLQAWNAKNPDQPIRLLPAQIRKRVEEARKTRADRFVKTAPKEIRPAVAKEIRS